MAVQEQTPLREYTANGVTTSFALGFDCEETNHLIVTIDDVEVLPTDWYLSGSNVIFWTAPGNGKLIKLQRNTPFNRLVDYQSYNNSFRPPAINKEFDRIWWKLQELGVADWILHNRIDALKAYVDDRDDELRAYLMEEIRKQGVALDQLDEYYNYLMQRLAQIAVDKGWDASFVVDGDRTQKQINDNQKAINARTVTPYDFGAIGDGVAHPLSERYATLAEAQAVYPSATSLTEYIDGHALNAWWRDICANNRKFATCHGEFRSNTVISNAGINSIANIIKTRHVDFNAKIVFEPDEIIENGFEIISPRQCQISGFLELIDAGGVTWANRKVNNLIYAEDFIHGVFLWKVVLRHARFLGLKAFSGAASISGGYANNNTSNLGSWQFASCGHRFKHNTFAFTSRSDIGASSATDQRTVLTLSSPHNLGDLTDSIIRFKSKPYLVTGSTDSTLTVYPWLEQTDSTGTIEISKGGDFRLEGADSNLISITGGSADCAICAGKEGFYVGAKMGRTNEANDVGLRLGNLVSNVQVGATYHGAYFELNEFDIVKTNVNADNAIIINPIALNLSKCHVLAPISAGTRRPNPTLISPFTVIYGDKVLGPKKLQTYLGINEVSTQTVKLGDSGFKIRSGSATITLADDTDVRRIFGTVDVEFEVFSVASNNGTGANTTIKHQAGYTINGVAGDLVIPPQNAPFKVSARLVNGTDWRVYVFYAERPKGSETHDWAPLAAGEQQSTTVTVSGAVVGNAAVASMDVALNGTSLRAEVTAANTVTVYHHNPTAAAVDVGSGTLSVKII